MSIEWSAYEDLLPSDLEVQPECLYSFKAPTDDPNTIPTEYKDWICDFWVSMDVDIPEGALLLCGSYAGWGWVGFENPVAVEAGTKVPLLGYALGEDLSGASGLPYESVVVGVGEFLCGVAHLDAALDGATFTVELRMTNPDDLSEYYNVNVVTYTFGALGTAGEGEIVK